MHGAALDLESTYKALRCDMKRIISQHEHSCEAKVWHVSEAPHDSGDDGRGKVQVQHLTRRCSSGGALTVAAQGSSQHVHLRSITEWFHSPEVQECGHPVREGSENITQSQSMIYYKIFKVWYSKIWVGTVYDYAYESVSMRKCKVLWHPIWFVNEGCCHT